MLPRHSTEDANNVGTWAPEHVDTWAQVLFFEAITYALRITQFLRRQGLS